MNVIKQLNLLVRGRVRSSVAGLVEEHGLEIAHEAIEDVEFALVRAKQELGNVVVQRRALVLKAEALRRHVSERHADGREALVRGDVDLARRLAEDAVAVQTELEHADNSARTLNEREQTVRAGIKGMVRLVEQYRTEYDRLAGMEAAARADSLMRESMAQVGGELTSLRQLLDQVGARQVGLLEQARADDEIAAELSGADLESALLEAGIGGRRDAVEALLDVWRNEVPRSLDAKGPDGTES